MRPGTATTALSAAKAAFLAAILSTGAALGGCASPQASASGDLARVKPPMETVTPDMFASAEAAVANGHLDAALRQYQHILAIQPQSREAELGLGEAYLAAHRPEEAHAAFDAAADRPELRARALQGRGLAALVQGHDAEAKASLQQATVADPTLWRAWNALAAIADREQRWTDAHAAYQRALATSPTPALMHNNLGFSLLLQKRYAEAAAEFKAALQTEPRLGTAQSNLRLALAWQGQYSEAVAEAKADEKPAVLNNVGYVAMMRHDYAAAETYLSQAMADSPSYYETAAQNLRRLKDAADAQPAAATGSAKREVH